MFENKTDYELFSQYIKNDKATAIDKKNAVDQLWHRYEALTHKMGHVLEARKVKNDFYGLNTETYYSDFYDAFLKAIDGLKLSKIKTNHATWKFWIQYYGYLRSANRDKINEYCRETKKERPITVMNKDGEEVLLTDICAETSTGTVEDEFFEKEESKILREVIKNGYNKFSDKQKKIWDMRSQSNSFTDIAKSMGVSSSSIKYQMNRIKDILKVELDASNCKHSSDIMVTCLKD